jgi:DNA polymerase-3 subunit epsilon
VLFLDFETTGIEETDAPIELGMVLVRYNMANGEFGQVFGRYSAFEDPGRPIPEEITALTGIRDEDVAGKHFDESAVESLARMANIVVAHNARFDRQVAERRFGDLLANKAWACSMEDVPWQAEGIPGTKLEFVAFKTGWFYHAHRAVCDAEVIALILGSRLSDDRTAMIHLLEAARRERKRVWASGAPYETKGILKARRYAWSDGTDGKPKAWWKETQDLEGELSFLRERVYAQPAQVLVESVRPIDRFTTRSASAEWVQIS